MITAQQTILQSDRTPAPIVRFSEFLGIGYFGDKKQRVIAPILICTPMQSGGGKKVMASQQQQQGIPLFHTVFVEHVARYEFIAHPIEMSYERVNYVLYRSSSSLSSLTNSRATTGTERRTSNLDGMI